MDELLVEFLKFLIVGNVNKVGFCLVIGLGIGFNIVFVYKDLDCLIVFFCEVGYMIVFYWFDLFDFYVKIEVKCGGVCIEWFLVG